MLLFTRAIRKTPFGLLRSCAPIFAHKKALPSSLCIQVIPHASMVITRIHVMSELEQLFY